MDFLQMLPANIREGILTGTFPASSSTEERAEKPDSCPLCGGLGTILRTDERGYTFGRPCKCQIRLANERRLARSGLAGMVQKLTFERWQSERPWQQKLCTLCEDYAKRPDGWLVLSGRPGTGKTHLCTAVCGALMRQGREVRYVIWRDFATRAKAVTTDEAAYSALIEPLKATPVLYLDDFFKTGRGQQPTAGDINLAFELLNARYNDSARLTILSTELTANDLLEVDEALGSRIVERSRGHYADLSMRENWRLRQ